MSSKPTIDDVVRDAPAGLAQGADGAEGDDVAGHERRIECRRARGARAIAAWPLGASKAASRDQLSGRSASPAPLSACPVAVEPFLGGGVHERRVRDAGDPSVTQRDQVLDGAARTGHVVDVDAGHRDARQAIPGGRSGSRRGPARAATGRRRADPRSTSPSACWARSRAVVGRIRTVGRQRLDHDPEATGPRGGGEPAQGLGQDGVTGDLLGGLAQDQGDDVTAATGQLAGRRMRVVARGARRRRGRAAASSSGILTSVRPLRTKETVVRETPGLGRDIGAGRSSRASVGCRSSCLDGAPSTWSTNACQ